MRNARWQWGFAWLVVLLLAGGWWLESTRRLAQIPDSPDVTRALQDPAAIDRGHYLATAGDCVSCHTAQDGRAYAGGRRLPTPFGSIAVPNITPDVETGLGQWTFEDFWRAVHSGIGRHGEWLYPAFSYTSFTKMTRADAWDIYAYLRSLPPIRRSATPNTLRFPYNMRGVLVAWRTLYFKPGVFQPDPAQSARWNRGAYLVLGIGHCNECHAARDAWGGIDKAAPLSGGLMPVQDWYAPDLSTQAHGGLAGWTQQDIVDLLKTGQSAKGAALGPMADVVASSTQYLRDEDLQAMAEYLHSLPPRPVPAPQPESFDSKTLADRGADIYVRQCADCHGKQGEGVAGVYPSLDGNASVMEPTGVNATHAVLLGGFAPVTAAGPRPYSMPPYAQRLSDADVAAVVTYIRQAWSNRASAVQERDVATYRHTPID